jgi:hypothetical protein
MVDSARDPLPAITRSVASESSSSSERVFSPGTLIKVALAAWILFLAIACGFAYGFWVLYRPIPFDSSTWKSSRNSRPRMVDDLLSKSLLDGMSSAEIDSLLGPPDLNRNGTYVYWAGTDGVIDDLWLEVDFESDRVTHVRHVPD